MKVKLGELHDGLNELHLQTTISDLGLEGDAERTFMFPAKISVDLEIQKLSDRYFVKARVSTFAHYVCDRCLEEFDLTLEGSFQLYYTKDDNIGPENDEYRFLSKNDDVIDITHDVVESLLLAVPMKHLCKDSCLGLCPVCGTNLNLDKCTCEKETIDPRWEKLRSLK